MPVETNTDVSEIDRVQDRAGNNVPPASDDFDHAGATGVDVNAATETVTPAAPGRASTVVIHVEGWDGAGHVEVEFQDADGNALTLRDDSDNSDYGTDGTHDVYVATSLASPWFAVRIVDESGASNTVDYSVYVR